MHVITKQDYVYEAYGLRVRSDMELPELAVARQSNMSADVDIRVCSNEAHVLSDDQTFMKDGKLYVNIKNTALYCIHNGHTITVTFAKGGEPDKVRLYLLGSCMGAILMQRGMFPLHGSAVVLQGKAYVIIGQSGAGKSTLATALRARGGKLLSDDVAAVSLTQDRRALVAASYPQQKLWRESLLRFKMKSDDYRLVLPDEDKYAVPALADWHADCAPLGGIYELVKTERIDRPELCTAAKLEQLHLLLLHTYRHSLIKRMGLIDWHFRAATSLLQSVAVKRLLRPADRFTADELATILMLDSKGDYEYE